MNVMDKPQYSEKHETGHRTDLPLLPSPQERPSLPALAEAGVSSKMLRAADAALTVKVGRGPSEEEIRQLKALPRAAI